MRSAKGVVPLLAVAALTVFSLVVFQGYRAFLSDQELYIPSIYRSLEPALFQSDLLLSFRQTAYTLFDELVTGTMGALDTDIFDALFILTLVFRFIYFYSLYAIALYFTKDRTFSVLSVLLFVGGCWVYGAAVSTLEIYLTPRVTSLALNLLFLALFFRGRRLLSTIPLGAALLLHPLTSVPFIIFFYLELFPSFRRKGALLHSLLPGAVPVLFFFLFLSLADGHAGTGLLAVIDPAWEAIIRGRAPQIFISSWDHVSYALLAASACLFAISRLELRTIFEDPARKRHLLLLFFIPLFLFLLSFASVDILKLHFFAQLQASRSLVLWVIFIPLLFSYFAYTRMRENPRDLAYNFALAGLILSFIFSYPSAIIPFSFSGRYAPLLLFLPMFLFLWCRHRLGRAIPAGPRGSVIAVLIYIASAAAILAAGSPPRLETVVNLTLLATLLVVWNGVRRFHYGSFFPFLLAVGLLIAIFAPSFSIYPWYYGDRPLLQACRWIEENTVEEDVFIGEPFSGRSGPLRLTCRRNLFTAHKDGAQVTFSREYAFEWKRRMELARGAREEMNLIEVISREYGAGYLLSGSRLDVPYPLAFDNSTYFIYKLR